MTKTTFVLSIVLGLVIGAAGATTATAQELGEDEVALKNGGSIRGTIVAVAPGESVKIIEMGSTETRTIQWSEVAEVQKGKHGKKTTVEPGSAGQGYSGAPPPQRSPQRSQPRVERSDREGVRIHIESPKPATLMHVAAVGVGQVGNYIVHTALVEPVCASPCDDVVPVVTGSDYYISGDGFPNAGPIYLDATAGSSNIVVEPGSSAARAGGWVMVSLGGAGVLAGTLGILLGTSFDSLSCTTDPVTFEDVCPEVDHTAVYAGGGVGIGLGAGAIIGGAILIATSGSKATVESGGDVATLAPWIGAAAPLSPAVGDAPVIGAPIVGVRGTF